MRSERLTGSPHSVDATLKGKLLSIIEIIKQIIQNMGQFCFVMCIIGSWNTAGP